MESRRDWSRRLRRMADSAGVIDHEFFHHLDRGSDSRRLLSLWAIQDYFVSRRFPCLIGIIVGQIDDPESRHPMVQNLWEEHGEGALQGTHYSLYCDLLQSMGLQRDPPASAAEVETTRFVKVQEDLAKSNVFAGLGAFCYANEYLTVAEFRPIWRAVKEEFDTPSLRFFEENLKVDARHARQTEDTIESLLRTEADILAVEQGAIQALEARRQFYDAIVNRWALPMGAV